MTPPDTDDTMANADETETAVQSQNQNQNKGPRDWPTSRKWLLISLISANTLLTALGATIPAPGVPQLMAQFHSDNELLQSFVVSVYVLGFALGPLLVAPASETYGRRPAYLAGVAGFLIWNVACALAPSMAPLMVFRLLAGSFGAAPFTLGGGTIADMVEPAQRGHAMGIWMAGLTVGPVLGPTIGGFVSAYLGWRWNFWILAITAGAMLLLMGFTMPETFEPVLLAKRARKQHKKEKQEQETDQPSSLPEAPLQDAGKKQNDMTDRLRMALLRPTKLLFQSLILFLICLYVAIAYTIMFVLFTTFTEVFEDQYGIPTDLSGLVYLGWGVGSVVGQALYVVWTNRFVSRRLANGTFKPEDRLPLMIPGGFLMAVGLVWYGWTAQARLHWIVPIVGTAFTAVGLTIVFTAPLAYLIDVFTTYAASAIAANVVMRSVFAAVIPLCGQSLYGKLGLGWGNTLLAFLSLACMPITVLFYYRGERIRTRYPVKL